MDHSQNLSISKQAMRNAAEASCKQFNKFVHAVLITVVVLIQREPIC